jgi:hypothetical protein
MLNKLLGEWFTELVIMDKQIQRFKDQYGELAKAVNAFGSEAVQIRVIDWLLTVVDFDKPGDNREYTPGKQPVIKD